MTALGATLYVGFFLLAALWLFVTRETGDVDEINDVVAYDPAEGVTFQAPVRSNSEMVSAGSAGSRWCSDNHSSQK